MTATATTHPLLRLYGTSLTPSARAELAEGLAPGEAFTAMSDADVKAYVHDSLASELCRQVPELDTWQAAELADRVEGPWVLLDPLTPASLRRLYAATLATSAPVSGVAAEPAPF